MKTYQGIRGGELNAAGDATVLVDGFALPLEPSLKIRNHSPDSFNWGYGGSGPAQLALALLLDCLKDEARAVRLYQAFKWRVVATWPQDSGWKITQSEIETICNELEQKKAQ